MSSQAISAEFPEKLECLFQPKRYKILYGGRGGAKSWGIARALLIMGVQRPIRVLCAREFQKSIAESVHKLLGDQIKALGLQGHYEVLQASIRQRQPNADGTQTEFSFAGIKHNIDNIKSYESVDIVWVEEAANVSKTSWDTLIPTIRKEGSEIWVSFNPDLEEDETYQRFVINPPRDSFVIKVNHSDNPWFPEVLRLEMEALKERDHDAYLNVWEGHCKQSLEGAIYARELREAMVSGRITRVAYDSTKPVHTFWDLGWSDHVSIWFAQSVGLDYRIIDFVQDRQRTIAHFLTVLQGRGYVYDTDYLPHDAQNKSLAANGRSIEDLMRAAGRKVRIVPKLSIEDGINAARTIFPNCYFDQERCADGLQALRHYRYEVDPDTGLFSKTPLHDQHSHAADAFRYLGVSLQMPKDKKPLALTKRTNLNVQGNAGWMGS